MKQKLFTLLALLSLTIMNAQVIRISDHNGKTLNACKGQFVSSKFVSNSSDYNYNATAYANNENYTVTFCAPAGKQIRANFYYYGIDVGDHLYVYDGPGTSSPQVGNLTGRKVLFPGAGGIFTSTGTCLTFKFTSNGSGTSCGWDAFIGCTPAPCVGNPPASDECITATEICNLGGYCGSTSGWYTRGAEADEVDVIANPSSAFCGDTHNNSWLSFNAATTSASFDITSSNCSDPSQGIQAVIMETANCKTFTRKSTTCESNGIGNFKLTANNLTPGKKYYIMIDGAFGNDCDYTILAKSGVQTLGLTASTSHTLCTGQPLTLTAHATGIGPFTYNWLPAPVSVKDDSIAVFATAAATTYTCIVSGVCGTPTSITYTPSANITPIVSSVDSARICPGGTGTDLTATLVAGSPAIDFKNTLTKIITDNNATGIVSDIDVGSITGLIGNQLLSVGINIQHGDVSELTVSLRAPNGSIIDLSTGKVAGPNYTDTYFSATAGGPITSGTAPFKGTYTPEQPFSTLSGGSINGTWSLIVKDKKALNTGMLTGWSLSFKNDHYFSWSPATGLSGTTGATVTANPASTTTYTVTLTDKAGCSGDTTVTVYVTDASKPLVTSPVVYCEGAPAMPLTATGNDLLWYLTATGGTGVPTPPTPSTATPDTLYFYVSQTKLACESEREKITVIILPAPTLTNSKNDKVCSGIPLNIALTGSINATYSWIADDNANTTGESHTSPKTGAINDVLVNTTTVAQIVKYNITLTSTAGCVNTTPQVIEVTVNRVKAAFTANPETGEMPLLVQFTNNSTTTTGVANYNWDFGTGSTSFQKDPAFTYDALGKYKVCLTVNDGQCVDSVCSTTVNVFINALLVIPNVFTPNGDGINDVFTILGKGIASLHGEVYNRWGQKEYEWNTPNGGWDGHSATGIPSPQGTYYVIITAKGMDGKDLLEKGAITLFR